MTANDVVKKFMAGMEEKQNNWIFCNDYPGTTPVTQDAYQKTLIKKQVDWLVDVSTKNGEYTIPCRGGRSLEGWMDKTHWHLFIRKYGSGILIVKGFAAAKVCLDG
ncbi:MAG: hypothetical protein KME52_12090 [Desmonostoc geniculatum HA4340-LM1]|jgi:hypothetical protein|nr:hypothetical protein [Desmonostoc geniculatum HA4340-LM1]